LLLPKPKTLVSISNYVFCTVSCISNYSINAAIPEVEEAIFLVILHFTTAKCCNLKRCKKFNAVYEKLKYLTSNTLSSLNDWPY